MNAPVARKISWKLGLGIFLLPIVFAWFLLQSGYSVRARILSFGWMILVIIGMLANATGQAERPSPEALEPPPQAAITAAPPKKTDARRVVEARQLVRARLKDPKSARFGDAIISDAAVCSTVNAKNGFGGYSGAQEFIVIEGKAFMREDAPEKWAQMWAQACTN